MQQPTGQPFGRYWIKGKIGEGGMAYVYKAWDTHLETEVAIKVIRRDTISPEMSVRLLKRFEREAKSLAKLTHTNIVRVIDYGEQDGAPYLVMPYIPGGTLSQRSGKPVHYAEAARILLPVARALEYAHSQGIIHRDVKPSNILITASGDPMLSDFGIAKLLEPDNMTSTLTGSNAGVGTPSYMAPEQWQGKTVFASDQYALGVILFELITGRRPYIADTPAGLVIQQATEPLPRLSQFVPGIPVLVENIVSRALAVRPEDRFPGMKAFCFALEMLAFGSAGQPGELSGTATTDHFGLPVRRPDQTSSLLFPSRVWILPVLISVVVLAVGVALLLRLRIIPGPSHGGTPEIPTASTSFQQQTTAPIAAIPQITPTQTQTVLPSATQTLAPTETAAPSNTPIPPTPVPTEQRPTSTPEPPAGPIAGESYWSPVDSMLLMYVPAGTFQMGALNFDTLAEDIEKPAHTVSLDEYWIDQTEITNEKYALCVQSGACRPPYASGSKNRASYYDDSSYGNFPVVFVTWEDARNYCHWADRELPTEAQWERAARGDGLHLYPWGDDPPDVYPDFLNSVYSRIGDTTEVGSHSSGDSPYGVHDMAGNVWEWVYDAYSESYYSVSPEQNPTGPGQGASRVLRGGSWNSRGRYVRISNRYYAGSDQRHVEYGFRCVYNPE